LEPREALRLVNAHTYYGDSHTLNGVSFSAFEGRVLGLLGRNGAGKTTCISTVIGLVPPRSGSITLYGQEIAGWPPEKIARTGVGLVPQGRRIFPTLTVRENLTIAGRKGKTGNSAWDFGRVCELFPRLEERRHHLGASLSGGEQQMLAIGRALMGNPRLLLLDEPSEGLAPLIVQELSGALRHLKQQGLTTILVEQNLKFALDVADDAAVIDGRHIVYAGLASDLRGRDEFLQAHLGVA
jgi:branched-chain amino acid transport system ATP-binding protein